MEKEKMERISHLSRKERTIGLNEEEKKEQAALQAGIPRGDPQKFDRYAGKYLPGG